MPTPGTSIQILPSASLPSQTWAPDLHKTINEAFKSKDVQTYPPSWLRLNPNPEKGILGLVKELGPHGFIAVALSNGQKPVACGGFLPSRGIGWIEKEQSADAVPVPAPGEVTTANPAPQPPSDAVIEDWELCCFCVHPTYRRSGVSQLLMDAIIAAVIAQGAKRLVSNCVINETGAYWERLGFAPIAGATSVLKKGFTHTAGMESLRADIHYQMGVKVLR